MSRKWHKGPPPHVGWWEASWSRNTGVWRWWNGKNWGLDVSRSDGRLLIAEAALVKDAWQSSIEWTNYYPKNARVPRIDPRKASHEQAI